MKLLNIIIFCSCLYTLTFAQNFRISGSNTHSVALCNDGSVYAWGDNSKGQLGINPISNIGGSPYPNTSYDTPKYVGGLSEISKIDAGSGAHSLAVTCEGKVYAWGANVTGQLGNPIEAPSDNVTKSATPVLVLRGQAPDVNGDGYLGDVNYVSGGNDESFAVLNDGRLVAWGQNDRGQLGNGNTVNQPTPVFVLAGETSHGQTAGQPLLNVVQVEAGDENGYALTADGIVWSWGDNEGGGSGASLGRNTLENTKAYPVMIYDETHLTKIISITAGDRHVLMIDENGIVWSIGGDWGPGQRGISLAYDFTNYAVQVSGGESGEKYLGESDPIIEIAAGQGHSVAVSKSGYVYSWGANGFFNCGTSCSSPAGQLGIGNATNLFVSGGMNELPLKAKYADGSTITNAKSVSAGDAWTFVIAEKDRIFVTGWNREGQLGIGSTTNATRFIELDLAALGCGLPTLCPNFNISDYKVCPRDIVNFYDGELPSGFKATWEKPDGTKSVITNPWFVVNNPKDISFSEVVSFIYETGTYKLTVEDERTRTQRHCAPCPVLETTSFVEFYQANFNDPGDLTFCEEGNVNVEETGLNSIQINDYSWYSTLVSGKLLGETVDEGTNNIDFSDHSISMLGTSPNRVAELWVEDKSAFTTVLAKTEEIGTTGNLIPTSGDYSRLNFDVFTTLQVNAIDVYVSVFNTNQMSVGIFQKDGTPVGNLKATPSNNTNQNQRITFDGNIILNSGSYYIQVISNNPVIYQTNSGSAFSIYEYNGNDLIRFTSVGNESFGFPGYTNWSVIVGNEYACGRVLVKLVEECPTPCNKPISVFADAEGCDGVNLTLKGSYVEGSNVPTNIMSYVWYKQGNTPLKSNYVNILNGSVGDLNFNPIKPNDEGTWVLRVEDGNSGDANCYTETTVEVEPLVCTTITDEVETNFSVYPNPASRTLSFSGKCTNLKVYNSLGLEVYSSVKASQLNVQDWEVGLYFVKSDQGIYPFQVIE